MSLFYGEIPTHVVSYLLEAIVHKNDSMSLSNLESIFNIISLAIILLCAPVSANNSTSLLSNIIKTFVGSTCYNMKVINQV